MTSGYLCALLVAVVVDGAQISSDPTAALTRGRIIAPAQLIAQFADRVTTGGDGVLIVQRAGRTCAAPPRSDDLLHRVALAPLVRCLRGAVSWDPKARTMSIAFPQTHVLRTPAPFDPHAPQVAPTAVFTAEPTPPPPRVIATGVPRPRRTAIPVVPSWPIATKGPRP